MDTHLTFWKYLEYDLRLNFYVNDTFFVRSEFEQVS